ncbi:hypothetical protein IP81_08820 [Novosphingobium sp. AAP83]|uniref:hypothetical protein n=1 Tax=Novosphingobium sp. AAP83 TaxID=1523425 RepID=UPI0006B88779|nr:hypothetical protein [Novosphingobium sp. AAP83]KPF92120.1 hypothetical protein IP81_08820 [Novosphingobium sp. AAP83]
MGFSRFDARRFYHHVSLAVATLCAFFASVERADATEFLSGISGISAENPAFILKPVMGESALASSDAPAGAFGPSDTVKQPTPGLPQSANEVLDPELDAQRIRRRKVRTIERLEIAYQLLGVLDAAQTISCVDKPNCRELNPLLGSRPSVARIVGFKLAAGLLHYAAMRREVRQDRLVSALRFEILSISVQGIICGLNFRHAF